MNRFLVGTALLAVVAPACSAQQQGGSWRTDFENRTVAMEEIVPGGPPKDGIPPIDRPTFVSVDRADRWLDDREPVVMVRINGEAKAYPLQILIWHEIVNDEVGGVPVTVTFCPLCNTALAFDRRHNGRVLDFGTTGWLRHSDLVMYDRQTETWWQQATGEAIVGEMAGDQLDFLHAPLINWDTFKTTYPEGQVLSKDTGHSRPYGQNPYESYDTQSRPYRSFFFPDPDARLPAMERIAAVQVAEETVAFPFSGLQEQRVIHDEVGGISIVAFWAPGTASALDAGQISRGRDVGSSGVYRRTVDGRQLTFEPAGDGRFRDRETGSTWDVLGRAVGGPLEGTQLTPVQHGNHFWFAWAVFKPDTRIVR